MIKTISLWVKNDSKWNILLFIFVLWILYVFSVSGDGKNPMNNGYGFPILSLFYHSMDKHSTTLYSYKEQINDSNTRRNK